jgi:predicted O-methyltransferase YrrM
MRNNLKKIKINHVVELKALNLSDYKHGEREPITVALALVKNEADIISLWLSHVCELFDLVYIVDHQSTDGTREFLIDVAKSENKILLYSFDQPGYFQSEITNKLAQCAAQKYPHAWLFPIDADEFLSVRSRNEFTTLLETKDPKEILLLNWLNCVPMYLNNDNVLKLGFSCLFSNKPSVYNKVAVNSRNFLNRGLRFFQGNHFLVFDSGHPVHDKQTDFTKLYHLPIRNVEHFALKCIQGVISYKQLPPQRNSTGQGVHWKNMIDSVLTSGFIDPNIIREFITTYGQNNKLDVSNIDFYKLIDFGWTIKRFNVPIRNDIYSNFIINRKYSFLELAQQLLEIHPEYKDLINFFQIIVEYQKLIKDAFVWKKESNNNLRFKKLPSLSKDHIEQDISDQDIEVLYSFLSKAFTPRESPMPSTWESHVPFLYCLLNFIKPRRFVELGTQYGNCFFAACQMSRELNDSIECIAIDTWTGDVQTGKYDEDVFKQFLNILYSKYPKGKYIRKLFMDAARQFEPGSIDLLHIDGLHTYEAVVEDYQTWLPMISDQGIIMFHDTQECEGDYGVWKLWAELEKKYPSIEFEHGHGLGVILVGKKAPARIKKLFEIFGKHEYARFIKFFFSNIGKISPIR